MTFPFTVARATQVPRPFTVPTSCQVLETEELQVMPDIATAPFTVVAEMLRFEPGLV